MQGATPAANSKVTPTGRGVKWFSLHKVIPAFCQKTQNSRCFFFLYIRLYQLFAKNAE